MLAPILIVEDHDAVRNSLRDWLELVLPRFRVIEATSGEEAIDLLDEETPSLIVMALNLPGMNGIEATRQIKAMSPSTQIVIMTIHEDRIYKAYAQAAGASAIIPKLSTPSILRPTLISLLPNT
jgi:NarL family two-component system response regulator LiaR